MKYQNEKNTLSADDMLLSLDVSIENLNNEKRERLKTFNLNTQRQIQTAAAPQTSLMIQIQNTVKLTPREQKRLSNAPAKSVERQPGNKKNHQLPREELMSVSPPQLTRHGSLSSLSDSSSGAVTPHTSYDPEKELLHIAPIDPSETKRLLSLYPVPLPTNVIHRQSRSTSTHSLGEVMDSSRNSTQSKRRGSTKSLATTFVAHGMQVSTTSTLYKNNQLVGLQAPKIHTLESYSFVKNKTLESLSALPDSFGGFMTKISSGGFLKKKTLKNRYFVLANSTLYQFRSNDIQEVFDYSYQITAKTTVKLDKSLVVIDFFNDGDKKTVKIQANGEDRNMALVWAELFREAIDEAMVGKVPLKFANPSTNTKRKGSAHSVNTNADNQDRASISTAVFYNGNGGDSSLPSPSVFHDSIYQEVEIKNYPIFRQTYTMV